MCEGLGMTKLTKEQIEKERVMFEKRFKGRWGFARDGEYYMSMYEELAFQAWIARAEIARGE